MAHFWSLDGVLVPDFSTYLVGSRLELLLAKLCDQLLLLVLLLLLL